MGQGVCPSRVTRENVSSSSTFEIPKVNLINESIMKTLNMSMDTVSPLTRRKPKCSLRITYGKGQMTENEKAATNQNIHKRMLKQMYYRIQ